MTRLSISHNENDNEVNCYENILGVSFVPDPAADEPPPPFGSLGSLHSERGCTVQAYV